MLPSLLAKRAFPGNQRQIVSQIVTVDRRFLAERCGRLSVTKMRALDAGLRLALSL